MKNKSIISAITFLLISMFYVASASAQVKNQVAILQVDLPDTCGAYKRMTNHHCPLVYTSKSPRRKRHDELDFRCKGGGNNRSVSSIMTQYCGRFTFTTFARWDGRNSWGYHYADVAYGRHKYRKSATPDIVGKGDRYAVFDILLLNTNDRASRVSNCKSWRRSDPHAVCLPKSDYTNGNNGH
jgi:hypothetical protein